jgi:hypothetical protein
MKRRGFLLGAIAAAATPAIPGKALMAQPENYLNSPNPVRGFRFNLSLHDALTQSRFTRPRSNDHA